MTAQLPLPAAVELGASLVARVAEQSGVRVMFIKGAAAVAQGVRAPDAAHSLDVDVLVEPGAHGELAQSIAALGWRARRPTGRRSGARLEHSVTLSHPEWPCDIDLHHYFPGLFGDPSEVFEGFWDSRETVEIAGRNVATPGRAQHCLVLLCNALRDQSSAKAAHDVGWLSGLIDRDRSRWAEILEAADRARAGSVLRPFAEERGYELPLPDVGREEMLAWELSTSAAGGLGAFVYWFPRSTWPQRWGMVKDALSTDAEQLAARDPEWRQRGMTRWRGNLRRILRGVRELPALSAGLGRLRSASSADAVRKAEAGERAPSPVLAATRGAGPDPEALGIPFLDDEPAAAPIMTAASADRPEEGRRRRPEPSARLTRLPLGAVRREGRLYLLPLGPLGRRRMPQVLTLDPVAARLFEAAARGTMTCAELVSSTARDYGLPDDAVGPSVYQTVEELIRREVLAADSGYDTKV